MPTTHIWKGASNPYIFDPTQYADGSAFAAGDTLVVSSGMPTFASISGNVVALITGTYDFTAPSGTVGFATDNAALDQASILAVTGASIMEWSVLDQFVINGAFQVGSATASGQANLVLSTSNPRP